MRTFCLLCTSEEGPLRAFLKSSWSLRIYSQRTFSLADSDSIPDLYSSHSQRRSVFSFSNLTFSYVSSLIYLSNLSYIPWFIRDISLDSLWRKDQEFDLLFIHCLSSFKFMLSLIISASFSLTCMESSFIYLFIHFISSLIWFTSFFRSSVVVML